MSTKENAFEGVRSGMQEQREPEEDYVYQCGQHCKLCPFPGYKCHGRPTKLNGESECTAFTELYADKNLA